MKNCSTCIGREKDKVRPTSESYDYITNSKEHEESPFCEEEPSTRTTYK